MPTVQSRNEMPSSPPKEKVTSPPPTAPGRLPLLGHLIQLITRPLSFVQDLRAHGDIVRIFLGPQPAYMVNSPELLNKILVNQAGDFAQGRIYQKASAIFGDSLMTLNGPEHQQRRRLLQPTFKRERVASYAPVMAEVVAAKTARWRPGQVVDVTAAMLELTMGMVARTLFTQEADNYDTGEIERLLVVILDGIAQRMFLSSSLSLLEKLPIPSNRRFDAAKARLLRIMEPIIQSHRADHRDRGDMLSTLLLARDQEAPGGLTDRQVQDQLTESAITAYETTGITLSWFFHELGRNPEVERRIHTEVDAVLAGRRPGLADVAPLEYTRRALTETLRLHHPFWVSMRRTCNPVNLGGADIPQGVELLFSPYALHRDPVLFSDPLTFDPDRWLPDRADTRHRHAFLPFGAGRRICIGESFAVVAMTLAVATITSRWQLRPQPGHVVRERPNLAVHPDRLPMTAVLRHPQQ